MNVLTIVFVANTHCGLLLIGNSSLDFLFEALSLFFYAAFTHDFSD